MKKIQYVWWWAVGGLLMLAAEEAQGKFVNPQAAQLVATNFYQARQSAAWGGAQPLLQITHTATASIETGGEAMLSLPMVYVFNDATAAGGFVLVAADDRAVPVLGYSTESDWEAANLPINAAKWLEGYVREMQGIVLKDMMATPEITAQWTALQSGVAAANKQGVAALVSTKWNQGQYYNALCPSNSVTGCVATAMAQVLKYWEYPVTGTGFHSYQHPNYGTISANFGGTQYNWNGMPNTVNSANSAVATLMFHCGVSVDMYYSPQSSGAFVIDAYNPAGTQTAESALRNHFGYSAGLNGVLKSNYTSANWINLLKSELDNGRPMLYAGFGSGGGHAFVCDGYDNSNYFHFNWGWGGSSDGYFLVSQLNPGTLGAGGGSGGFNTDQQAIIGIEPTTQSSQANMRLYEAIVATPNPIGFGQPVTVTTDILNQANSTFYGEVGAALFDQSYGFVEFVSTVSVANGLQPNYHFSNGLTFSSTGLTAAPGNYYLSIFTRATGATDWVQAANGSYNNFLPVSIGYDNDLKLYAGIVPTPNPIIQGQAFTVKTDVGNYGTSVFSGRLSVDLHDLSGNWIETIAEIPNLSLCANCHFTNGVTFSSNTGLDVDPGTYLLAIWEKANNGNWELVGSSSNYGNPVQVVVSVPSLAPDGFESNNTENAAYNMSLSFSNDVAFRKTTGSNLHVSNDLDYYKVVLPAGFEYNIAGRVHDSYSAGNGQTYTGDVLWSYNKGGGWSTTFDDLLIGNAINVTNGGTVYFQVAPYFQGYTGTYLLDLTVTRLNTASTHTALLDDGRVQLFPNPVLAGDGLTLVVNDPTVALQGGELFDIAGKLVRETTFGGVSCARLSTEGLTAGTYWLVVKTTDQQLWRKQVMVMPH